MHQRHSSAWSYSTEHLHRWTEHPDEIVAWSAFNQSRAGYLSVASNARAARDAACRRALADLEAEGVYWNPVVDQLSAKGIWAMWAKEEEDDKNRLHLRTRPTDAGLVDRLVPWIQKQHDATALLKLLEFQSPFIWRAVATHARAISSEIVQRLCQQPSVLADLCANPHLPPDEAHASATGQSQSANGSSPTGGAATRWRFNAWVSRLAG